MPEFRKPYRKRGPQMTDQERRAIAQSITSHLAVMSDQEIVAAVLLLEPRYLSRLDAVLTAVSAMRRRK